MQQPPKFSVKHAAMSRSRIASLAIFGLGLIASFWWAWWQLSLFAQDEQGPKCGLPILGILGVTIIAAGVTSLLSTALNNLSFRASPKPRSTLRILELLVLMAPAVLAATLIGVLFFVD